MQKCKVNSTQIEFGILQWQKYPKDDYEFDWCESYLSITNKYLNYKNTGEFLCQQDWVYIAESMEMLLLNQMENTEELGFVEPDIEFRFFPGDRCCMELAVHFWDTDGLNGEVWTALFNREEIEMFLAGVKAELERVMHK